LNRVHAFIRIASPDNTFEGSTTHGHIAEFVSNSIEDVFLLVPDRGEDKHEVRGIRTKLLVHRACRL
jgi:hypothetical protein